MITPDENSPALATGPAPEIEAFLDAAATGRGDQSAAALDDSFVRAVGEILRTASATAEVVLSGPLSFSTHRFTLSRGGTLRQSQGQSSAVEISALPTAALPGALLRLAGIASVEPLSHEATLSLTSDSLEALFSSESAARTAAWSTVVDAARVMPAAEQPHLEESAPRAARLVRHRPDGDRTSLVLLVRGRYLVPAEDHMLRGTDPTGAARALLSAMLNPGGR